MRLERPHVDAPRSCGDVRVRKQFGDALLKRDEPRSGDSEGGLDGREGAGVPRHASRRDSERTAAGSRPFIL